ARQGQLAPKDMRWLEQYFIENIFPVLTPIAIDPAHPFPFLPNLGLAVVFQLAGPNGEAQMVIVPLPAPMRRFILLPGKKTRYVMLEDVIDLFLGMLLTGFTKTDAALFRIIRDSELDVEEEGEDFVRNFERAVKQRRRGRVIQIKFAAPASKHLVHFVSEQ